MPEQGGHAKSKIELTNENSVFIEIRTRDYCGSIELPLPKDLTMSVSANVIDFALYRKRRQARAAAELMWTAYAARAGIAVFFAPPVSSSSDTRRA